MATVESLSAAPRRRKRKRCPRDFQKEPYLRGLPSLPQYAAWLAGRKRLTAEQEALIDAHLVPIREAVRDASEAWNGRADDWDAWAEPTDAELRAIEN
jgi:hypothetical protein